MGIEEGTNKAQNPQGGVKTRSGFSTFSSDQADTNPEEYGNTVDVDNLDVVNRQFIAAAQADKNTGK